MPRLPSTIRSASFSLATLMIESAGSPFGAWGSISTPSLRARLIAESRIPSTLKSGPTDHSAASAAGAPVTRAGDGL